MQGKTATLHKERSKRLGRIHSIFSNPENEHCSQVAQAAAKAFKVIRRGGPDGTR